MFYGRDFNLFLYGSFISLSLNREIDLLVGIKIRWLIQSDFVCINQEEAWDFCGDKHSFNDLSFTQLLIICVVISCLSFAFNYTLPTQLNIKEYLHTRRNIKTTSTTHAIVWLILLLLCPCFSVFEIFVFEIFGLFPHARKSFETRKSTFVFFFPQHTQNY